MRYSWLHQSFYSAFLCSKPEGLPGTELRAQCCQEVTFEKSKRIIEIQQLSWICHLIFFLSSPPKKPHLDCHSLILTKGKGYLSPGDCWGGKVLFRNSQEENASLFLQDRQNPNVSLCHLKNTAVLTISSCHTLCFSSSRTPSSAKFVFLCLPPSHPLPLAKTLLLSLSVL